MKYNISFILSAVVFMFFFQKCATNAITGRKQLSLISESEVQNMALTEYKSFLSGNKVISPSSGNKDALSVQRVGNKVINAIKKYYAEKGLANEIVGYNWEINTVNSNEVNAWCMPGGKIVVYTGILPITQNDNALAVVMGHEIAHALAKHGSERLSQGMVQQFGGAALSAALSSKPAETQNLFMNAYGIGSQVGAILPFSRKNELEADKLGLMFSALAGYDPKESILFWQRMSKVGSGQKPPEFMSTHPADETRIQQLKKIMPDILTNYYKPQ